MSLAMTAAPINDEYTTAEVNSNTIYNKKRDSSRHNKTQRNTGQIFDETKVKNVLASIHQSTEEDDEYNDISIQPPSQRRVLSPPQSVGNERIKMRETSTNNTDSTPAPLDATDAELNDLRKNFMTAE